MLSCEGSGFWSETKRPHVNNMIDYMVTGGRLFLSHMHFNWLARADDEAYENPAYPEQSSPIEGTALYGGVQDDLPADGITAYINTTFPKGNALADWLVDRGVTPKGQFTAVEGQHSINGVVAPTQEWIYVPNNPANDEHSTQYLSFNTPVGAAEENQCGRVVYTDLHLNAELDDAGGDSSQPGTPFPNGCTATSLTPQALALVFMFFDPLRACSRTLRSRRRPRRRLRARPSRPRTVLRPLRPLRLLRLRPRRSERPARADSPTRVVVIVRVAMKIGRLTGNGSRSEL